MKLWFVDLLKCFNNNFNKSIFFSIKIKINFKFYEFYKLLITEFDLSTLKSVFLYE